MGGFEIRSMDVRIIITDISTTRVKPALLGAPAMERCVPYQKAKSKAPNMPKN